MSEFKGIKDVLGASQPPPAQEFACAQCVGEYKFAGLQLSNGTEPTQEQIAQLNAQHPINPAITMVAGSYICFGHVNVESRVRQTLLQR